MPRSKAANTNAPATGTLAIERSVRLWAGLVLFAFVLTHLLNHALGIFGVAWMQWAQDWRSWVWRTVPGSILLYGAAAVHALLALKRLVSRRTWRMPWKEAIQIALGLLIPVLVVDHAVATRYLASYHGFDDSYHNELRQLWPGLFWKQTALLLVVWTHAIIGINYVISPKSWYPKVRDAGLVAAIIIPLAALAGFVAGGREALETASQSGRWTPEQVAAFLQATRFANIGLAIIAAGTALIVIGRAVARRVGKKITIRYTGHGEVRTAPGLTLLEMSRANGVPHPSHCGGRARCSTCRVLVLGGLDTLPEPGPLESRLLKRIAAPSRVRLACQIWPQQDLAVQVLLPPSARPMTQVYEEESYKWGVEREVTVLFADIRGFTQLSRNQVPTDLVVILNRAVAEMSQAVEAHGGRVSMTLSDGILAIFGLNGSVSAAARSAVRAGLDIVKSARALTAELGPALPQPLRVGIGVHSGLSTIGRVGDDERGYVVTALGETVSIASRLEAATKEFLTDCLVSSEALSAAGLKVTTAKRHEIHARERAEPVVAYAVTEATFEEEGDDRRAGDTQAAEPQTAEAASS
jgi:adenylate cyclase